MAWGVAEEVIVNAFGGGRDEATGLLHICRTGPAAPPMTYMGSEELIVTSGFKEWLMTAQLGRFGFKPVVKDHIVKMDWNLWDETTDADLPFYDYVEGHLRECPHSVEASNEMGDLWEWIIAPGAIMDLDLPKGRLGYYRRIHLQTWNGEPVFRATMSKERTDGYPVVTEDAKNRILETWPKYWCFDPCIVL